jgi:uncharacterized protein with ParB-like and HNH nuclease domain/predicted transport protein
MQARDVFLTQLIQGPKQFLIPIFQRTYRWKEANCTQLFQDILRAGQSPNIQSHFIGSTVLIPSESTTASIPQWQVIDGQQRLTTVTLLIAALLKRAEEFCIETVSATPLQAVREYFLINNYGQGDAKYKLLLTKSDKPVLCSIVDQQPLTKNSANNINRNYGFFYDCFSEVDTIERIYQGLQKLKVVEVVLQAEQDDSQSIFESLNSTGVDLSQADLIRNYVLMRQTHEEQTLLYENQWFPMEQLFGGSYESKFDRFVQDFLTLVTASNSLVKAGDVYPIFKEWFACATKTQSVEDILKTLLDYARFYTSYSLLKEGDSLLRNAFADLRALVEVATPTVIRLYYLYENQKLSKKEFVAAIRLLESYILRRSVCDMQSRSLGNIFALLAHKIQEYKPLESLKVSLARFSKTSRFPNDTEFLEALMHKDLYESRICRFVLDKLENDSKEKIDISGFSIEHVMPQNETLRPEWRKMLGENWQQVQHTWLHRLGNLTLTGYNSEYSDQEFSIKKTIPGGFDESPLRLNRDMRDADQWTEQEMASRGKRLAEKAVQLWQTLKLDPSLIAKYELEEKKRQSEHLILEDVFGINETIKPLFGLLQEHVEKLGSDVSLVIERKNITFYTLEPFLQAIPRKSYLALVLSLDYEQLMPDLQEFCANTSDWVFIINASLNGVYCELHSMDDLIKLNSLIQQAYDEALA